MFVFRTQDLPSDPVFPADLVKLGYFVNDKDQIRKISDPEQEFQYKINRNPRWNELQREAMNECIRKIVSSRLRDLGLVTIRLPLTSGPNKPHVPISVSRNLSTASRIIVVFGESVQDLGIWAYRTMGCESIHAGSAVDFAKAVLKRGEKDSATAANETSGKVYLSEKEDVALVLANTGQLVWHCGSGRAITLQTWRSLPRPSAVDPAPVMTDRNKIPNNGNWQEHVNCVFNDILAARGQLVREDAKIDVVGLSEGGLGAIDYLKNNWDTWQPFISAICLSNPLHTTDLLEPDNSNETGPAQSSFATFISSRCRAYLLSHRPLGFPLFDSQRPGCNCYSSGEELNVECIMPKAWTHMLSWLNWAYDNPDYCEEQLVVREVQPEAPAVDSDEH